jgi:hypothetical protein
VLSDAICDFLRPIHSDTWHFLWQDRVNILDPSRLLHLPKTLLENQAQCTRSAQQWHSRDWFFFFWADRWMWSCRRTSQQWYWRTIQQEFMGVGPPSMETLVKTVKTTIFLTPEADCSRCFEQRCFEFAMFSTCFQLVHYVWISLDIYRSAGWDCCFMPCSCFSDRFTWTATNVTSVKDGLHILCQT